MYQFQSSHLFHIPSCPSLPSIVSFVAFLLCCFLGSVPVVADLQWPQLASWGFCEEIPTLWIHWQDLSSSVCSCWLGKSLSWSPQLYISPLVSYPVQITDIYTYCSHHVALHENKVFLSVFCALPMHTVTQRVLQPILLVNRALCLLALLLNDSTCPLQWDTRCFTLSAGRLANTNWPHRSFHLLVRPPSNSIHKKCVRK